MTCTESAKQKLEIRKDKKVSPSIGVQTKYFIQIKLSHFTSMALHDFWKVHIEMIIFTEYYRLINI